MEFGRKSKRIPKYRKHSTRNIALVEIAGKRHYLPGVFGSEVSKQAYRKLLWEHFPKQASLYGTKLPRPEPGQPVMIEELMLYYLEFAQEHYQTLNKKAEFLEWFGSPSKGEYYNMAMAIAPLADLFAGTEVAKFGPLKLKQLQRHLEQAGKSRKYINSIISRVRRCFRWGVSEELVPQSIYNALQSVDGLRFGGTSARELPARQAVKIEHVTAILAELSPTVRAMVQFQQLSGARAKSICRAKPEQFDRTADGPNWLWRPRHKMEHTGQELILPIGPKCQAVLLPIIESTRADQYLFRPREQRRNARYRPHYETGSYRQAIARAIERTNKKLLADHPDGQQPPVIPLWTPHQLRHAKGEEVREKYGIEAAQAVLGHASLDATQIYAHRQLALAMQVAAETG